MGKISSATDYELTPAATQNDLPDQSSSTSAPNMYKYNMYYTTSMCNVRLNIGDASSATEYYVQSKSILASPRLLLRRGPDKKAPVVAFAKCHYTSTNMIMGLGDCEDKSDTTSTTFEELTRDKNMFRSSDYRFSTEDGASGKRVELVWHKDRFLVGTSVYNCVDPQGQIVARMLSGGAWNWKKGGEIEIAEEGVDLATKELLLVSGMAIWAYEGLSGRSYFRGYNNSKEKGKTV